MGVGQAAMADPIGRKNRLPPSIGLSEPVALPKALGASRVLLLRPPATSISRLALLESMLSTIKRMIDQVRLERLFHDDHECARNPSGAICVESTR
jgi:hypothetical protein